MHLPKSRFETLNLASFKAVQNVATRFPRPHSIALIPDVLLESPALMRQLVEPYEPTLIIAPPERFDTAHRVSSALDFTLAPVSLDGLDQWVLDGHWATLTSRWSHEWPGAVDLDPSPPLWSWPIEQDGSLLSLIRLSRLMGDPLKELPIYDSPFDSALKLRYRRVQLDALVQLDDEGVGPDEVGALLPKAMSQRAGARARLSISLPGVSSRYIRFSAGSNTVTESTFDDGYPEVRTLLVAHSALSDDSAGLVLEDALPPEAFHALADLERHWIERAQPAVVRRLLARMDASASSLWSDPMIAALKSASSIDAFTNFPIGLLTLPGDTSPLAARIPISYRPVNPLTRALQFELSPQVPYDLSHGFKVLVAECIRDSDPVGRLSRMGWKLLAQELSGSATPIELTVRETLRPEEVRAAVAEVRPDILVLSAHGFSAPQSNLAGLVVGDSPSMGDDLGDMPPLVVLSACHTSPRGGGVVSVADLLIRAGATAVLSTLVPVDVRHNSQLMSRFFLHLALAAGSAASEPEASILDVWHRVQTSNVVVDLAYGNSKLQRWFSAAEGPSPLEQFMAPNQSIPLRLPHLYADAEARLIQIAKRKGEGEGKRVQNWLRVPGYLPESLMYTMLGKPSSLILKSTPCRDPECDQRVQVGRTGGPPRQVNGRPPTRCAHEVTSSN